MKSILSYVLTRTEKIVLLILVALFLLAGWYMGIYHPIQLRIQAADTTDLESEMEMEQMRAAKIKAMQAEIDENKNAGAPMVPSYNNFKKELDALNQTFGQAYEFHFQFSEPEEDGNTLRRNMAVSFAADNYDHAVEMMRQLQEGPYRMMIHDVTISSDSLTDANYAANIKTGRVTVAFSLTYYETKVEAENLNGLSSDTQDTQAAGGLANAELSNLERSELETAAEAAFGE